MIALDEEQLDGHLAIEGEPGGSSFDRHAFLHGRGAGGKKAIGAGELDDADAAGTDGAEALEIAERGNVLAIGASRLKDGFSLVRGDQLAINANGDVFGVCLGFHVDRLSVRNY